MLNDSILSISILYLVLLILKLSELQLMNHNSPKKALKNIRKIISTFKNGDLI